LQQGWHVTKRAMATAARAMAMRVIGEQVQPTNAKRKGNVLLWKWQVLYLQDALIKNIPRRHSSWIFAIIWRQNSNFFSSVYLYNFICGTNKSSTWRNYLHHIFFFTNTQIKKWSFCNVYFSMSQQNQFSPMRIHKRTATNKINLCTHLLRICVIVYKLKKSQP
jgi:hypothetical protein